MLRALVLCTLLASLGACESKKETYKLFINDAGDVRPCGPIRYTEPYTRCANELKEKGYRIWGGNTIVE